MIHDLGNEEEFPSLPIVPTTPSKPPLAKKTTLFQTSIDKSDEIVTKLANLINTRSDALEEMVNATRAEIKALKEKMGCIERRVEMSEQSTLLHELCDRSGAIRQKMELETALHPRSSERESSRGGDLYLSTSVTARRRSAAICDTCRAPCGSKRLNESRSRAVIIRFIVRRYREAVWKAAKNNPFLRDHGLHFTEDLTKEDRESRQKMWPIIKKAREEGKSAYFVGGRGYTEGVEIT